MKQRGLKKIVCLYFLLLIFNFINTSEFIQFDGISVDLMPSYLVLFCLVLFPLFDLQTVAITVTVHSYSINLSRRVGSVNVTVAEGLAIGTCSVRLTSILCRLQCLQNGSSKPYSSALHYCVLLCSTFLYGMMLSRHDIPLR
jgi:hypothetical protein